MPRIACVPSQISQVILNLLINAIQAIEATGRTEGGRIGSTTRLEGTWVADLDRATTAAGSSPRASPQLFDPFFTTKPRRRGDRAGPLDQPRDRHRPRRPDRGREPPRRGDLLPGLPALEADVSRPPDRPELGPIRTDPGRCVDVE